jgi:hypothetical protein
MNKSYTERDALMFLHRLRSIVTLCGRYYGNACVVCIMYLFLSSSIHNLQRTPVYMPTDRHTDGDGKGNVSCRFKWVERRINGVMITYDISLQT